MLNSADIAAAIIARRSAFADASLPMAEIDRLANDEERDLATLAACGPEARADKARALAVTLLALDGGPASPGELALLRSLLADVAPVAMPAIAALAA